MQVPFAVQSYQSASLPISAQRCKNAFAEAQPPDAKTQVSVFQHAGLEAFATCGSGPIRGGHVLNGVPYVVSGSDLYTFDASGNSTQLGTGITGSNRVSMDDNGTQVCIVNGGNGYIYTTTDGLVSITDADFHPANTVTFFTSHFVYDWVDTNSIFISGLLDGTVFDALDFTSAEVRPDNSSAVITRQDNLLVFGKKTIETMYYDSAQDFPLQRLGGGTVERGTDAPLSVAKEDNACFFLGDDRVFYRLDGITPRRISTHALESTWRSYSTISDAHCFVVPIDGHKFIHLTFPSVPATFVFDIATNLWHERESWDSSNNSLGRWRGNCYLSCYGHHLIGDAFDGRIGRLDPSVYTEYGNTLPVELISAPVHKDRKRLFFNRFELDIETGVGLSTGQGSAPQVMLEVSDDGGRTWKSPEAWQSMGAIGEYLARLRWMRGGNSYSRLYRLTKTDPVKFVLLAAHVDVSEGS